MTHHFIINPTAGKTDRSDELIRSIGPIMKARGLSWTAHKTECIGHGIEIARSIAERGEPVRLYACGGDGTLNEVVNGAAGIDTAAVTHFPAGSGNDFIKIFGAGTKQFFSLPALLDGEIVPIDLIECNGRQSINICSVGLDSRIAHGMTDFKRLPFVSGPLAYQLSLVTTLLGGVHHPYKVVVDGEEFDGRFTLLCACNGQYYGGSFHPAPGAMPDDGQLTFLLVQKVSRLKVAQLVGKYAAGRADELPDLIDIRRGREMHIVCDRVHPVNIDGERMDSDRVTFRLSDKKLNFIRPQGTSWHTAD